MLEINNIKSVIFDMDGTLIDNIAYHKKAWILLLEKYGIRLEPEQFHAQNHGTIDEMIKHFFGNDLPDSRVKMLGHEKEQWYRDLYKNDIKEIEGLTEFLVDIKNKKIKIGLATNCDNSNIDFVLDSLKIRKFFDAITGGHEVTKGKPDPEIYITTLKKLGIENNKTIVFEDSGGGIRSALQAGIKVIGITTTLTNKELIGLSCIGAIDSFRQVKIVSNHFH